MYGEVESDQSELLRADNFRGMSSGTTERIVDGIFYVRGLSAVPMCV